jgi:Na+/citrate or Na+/malate symporter
MKQEPKKAPPALLLRWEALDTWKQLAISFPVFAIVTFLINIGAFNQPVPRSILYGLFEGAVLSGLLAVVTRSERAKR